METNAPSNLNVGRQLAGLSPSQRALLELRLMQNQRKEGPRQMIPRQADRESAPLSYNQQGFWLLNQLMPSTSLYHTPTAVRLTGTLDVAALSKALNVIVARHDSLRTTFKTVDGTPMQVVTDVSLDMPLIDLGEQAES